MRKWLAAFTAVCIAAAVGGVLIVGSMRRQAKAVEVTGTTLSGDGSAAEGLIMETVYGMNRAYWTSVTEWTVSGTKTETQYRYLAEEPRLTPVNFGLSLLDDGLWYCTNGDMAEYWWNVYGRPVSNGGNAVEIPLNSITKYEPARLELVRWNVLLGDAYEAEDKINDFLRIKVPDWQVVRLSHTRTWDADFQEMYDDYDADIYAGEDTYYPKVMSAYTGEKLFFGVGNRSWRGQILDFSDTPGGYGVYMIPIRKIGTLKTAVEYEQKTLFDDYQIRIVETAYKTGEPEVVLPLKPEDQLLGMSMSEDLTKLFVLTLEDGRFVATVMDTGSLQVLARIDLCENDIPEDPTIECHAGENFGAFFFWNTDRLFVLYPYADGEWRPITLTGLKKLEIMGWYRFRQARVACDGERTAIVWDESEYIASEAFYLTVFDKEKPVYTVRFYNSLKLANRNENLSVEDNIRREDFRIRWKE